MSMALSINDKRPDLRILVLEKGLISRAASTKNAGFACFGSPTELLEDIEKMGEKKALDLVTMRWAGLKILKQRLTNDELGITEYGGYELLDGSRNVNIKDLNRWLMPVFKSTVFQDVSRRLYEFGFKGFEQMIATPFEAQLDAGKTVNAQWRKAEMRGIRVLTGCRVLRWENQNGEVAVEVKGQDETAFIIRTKKLVVTNNAFLSQLIPAVDIHPGRGQVLITHPIPNLKFKGSFHLDRGYVYFRNVGNRILIGGGRNKDFETERTLNQGDNSLILSYLKEILEKNIIPGLSYSVDLNWSGIMAFGEEKYPILQWTEPDVYLAVRLGGMGMALASYVGEYGSTEIINSIKS